jgi:hypothetical protein
MLHLLVDQGFLADAAGFADQADRVQVLRRQRQHDGVADGLMEAVVRAALEQRRQVVVGQVVIDVAELVVDRGQLVFGRRDAHLDAHVAQVCSCPRRWRGRPRRGRAAGSAASFSQNASGNFGMPSET